jgi:hypothetical protein
MIYARVIDGVIHDMAPLSDLFPTTTFPASGPSLEWLAAENLFEIQMRKAYNTSTQKLVQVQPYVEDGAVYGVNVVALSQEELDAINNAAKAQNEAQAKRLLEETDWSQLADVNLTNQADFTTYRAALRAIVLNPPVTVSTWPTRPAAVWAS